jgi:hypothetical protein
VYAELKVVERVEEFSCAAADVVDVGRATASLLYNIAYTVHSKDSGTTTEIHNCSNAI